MRPTHRARGRLTERCRRRVVAVTLLAGVAACAGTRGAVAAPAWEAGALLAHLVAGRTAESPPMLAALFRASVQPYLISWFRHDPAGILAELRMPVLIVQGTTDLQVGVDEARALHAARSDATLLVIEGMNHVLKPVGGTLAEQLPSYGQPDPAVHPRLVEGLASFVAGLQR